MLKITGRRLGLQPFHEIVDAAGALGSRRLDHVLLIVLLEHLQSVGILDRNLIDRLRHDKRSRGEDHAQCESDVSPPGQKLAKREHERDHAQEVENADQGEVFLSGPHGGNDGGRNQEQSAQFRTGPAVARPPSPES